jgi:hypothetical protein
MAPQASCAAPTTTKNARFWALSRPTVAAAAMLIAPAAMLARAIADRDPRTLASPFLFEAEQIPQARGRLGVDPEGLLALCRHALEWHRVPAELGLHATRDAAKERQAPAQL